jgi:hypothetical protein
LQVAVVEILARLGSLTYQTPLASKVSDSVMLLSDHQTRHLILAQALTQAPIAMEALVRETVLVTVLVAAPALMAGDSNI